MYGRERKAEGGERGRGGRGGGAGGWKGGSGRGRLAVGGWRLLAVGTLDG